MWILGNKSDSISLLHYINFFKSKYLISSCLVVNCVFFFDYFLKGIKFLFMLMINFHLFLFMWMLGIKSACTFFFSWSWSFSWSLSGRLSSWGTWERCSVTCGGGSQTRWRSCVGQHRTIGCQGNVSEPRPCNTNSCPIDGGWSKWSQWSICTRTVSGIQTRIRECTYPEPAHGGKDCNGTRAVVRECGNMSSCHEAFPLRFWQSGENPSPGIMEIYRKGSWQKLCTRSWDTDEENLTCKAVGYSNSVGYDNGTWYTDNNNASNTIHYNCTTLTECGGDIDSKAQICKVPVRLSGAKIEYGGLVEVFYQGKWGKICGSQWNFEDVEVICRQLGFKRAVAKFVAADVKEEQIPFVMSDVACNGDEPELASCPRTDGKLNVDCQNNDTAAQALCEPKTPPELNPELRNRSVAFNSTLNLTCIVRGDHPLQIKWTKNGVDLGNRNSNTYTVDHMTFDHAGLYGCTAVNSAGEKNTSFWIDVTVSPQIDVCPRKKSVPEGHPANFSCKATGVPEPRLSWSFNDGDLPSGVNQTSLSEGSFLELPYTTKQMEGTYKCTAENKADATTSSAYLHVFEKPTAEVSPRPYPKLSVGSELRLTCKVNKATVAIIWKKNDDARIPRAQIDT